MSGRLERWKPLLWLGAIVLAGVLLITFVRGGGGRIAPSAAPAAQTPASATAPAGNTTASNPATDTPPWMANAPGGVQAPGASSRALANGARHLPGPAEAARAVAQVRAQAERNERAADELLRQIDSMQASGQVPPGVNVQALRNNLMVAKRAQALAREMAELTQQAGGPARDQRVEEITQELQQLQTQLRYDVGGPAGAAPASTGGNP
jgi:hypothetical protein